MRIWKLAWKCACDEEDVWEQGAEEVVGSRRKEVREEQRRLHNEEHRTSCRFQEILLG